MWIPRGGDKVEDGLLATLLFFGDDLLAGNGAIHCKHSFFLLPPFFRSASFWGHCCMVWRAWEQGGYTAFSVFVFSHDRVYERVIGGISAAF